ncbi:hypothetical protein ABZ663_30805 [Streptomyces albidoflavus]|uniref:hypothetical protein n=1 Tax=Streptomyces albidoflavus TaxID=1886 RepID=UPI0033FB990C
MSNIDELRLPALLVRLPDPGACAAAMQRVGLWADTMIATAALGDIAYGARCRAWLTGQPMEPGPWLRPDALRLLKQVVAAHPSPAWRARADALATYGQLRRSASAHPDRVLEALARAHFLLALGPDSPAHRAARRLARAHALAASRP